MTSIDDDVLERIDYKTFVKIINNIPSCIFFKDTDLKYRFSSHCWEQLQTENINGKTDLEIRKDKENALLAMEMDRNIIRTGQGCDYIIKSVIDDHLSYLQLIKQPVFNDDGNVIGIVGLINDVTEKTILEQRLKELLVTDSLTGMLNRSAGTDIIINSLRDDWEKKAFCLIDIDKFKHINDNYGHQIGDKVLIEFANALKNSVREKDVVMRLGGDEFIVFLYDITNRTLIDEFVNRLHYNISNIKIDEVKEPLSVSIGVKQVTENSSFDSLYKMADDMMYEAKKMSGSSCVIIG